jgi:hypothetical protein
MPAKRDDKPKSAPARRGRRHLSKRDRLDLSEEWHPAESLLGEAMTIVKRHGAVPIFAAHLSRRRDGEQRLSVLGFFVAMTLLGMRQGHEATLVALTKIINGFGPGVLRRLGMPGWTPVGSYDRVHRLHKAISEAIEEGFEHIDAKTGEVTRCDAQWFTTTVLRSPIPETMLEWLEGKVALAIDGTEMESCGQFHSADDAAEVVLDGEATIPLGAEAPATVETRRRAAVLGVGPDGRNIYTLDVDARAGYRTGNNNHPGGTYVGRELHLGVAVSAIKDTDGCRRVTFVEEVPQLILMASLTPAGTHRGDAVIPSILEAHASGLCREVIVDPGYSLMSAERFHLLLQRAGVELTMMLVNHQRGESPGVGDARVIDGHPFGPLPEELVNLAMPPRGASREERETAAAAFALRAQYRLSRHKAPGEDGITRWMDPFTAGRLRSISIPKSMRNSLSCPLVEPAEGEQFATGIISAAADSLPLWQRTLFGTPAWMAAYGRRLTVETANSFLHGSTGSQTEISRGYTKLMRTSKILVFLAHTLAGLNHRLVRRWIKDQATRGEKQANERSRPRKRAPRKNRLRRFDDIELAGADPPT